MSDDFDLSEESLLADAVEARAGFGFQMRFATSGAVVQTRFDLEPARRWLDWSPQDQWPDGTECWTKVVPP